MAVEKQPAEVAFSFLEYQADYREPVFEAWERPGAIALSIFRAFRKWDVSLDNISGNQSPANASEIQLNTVLLNKRANFSVRVGATSLLITNPSWEEKESIIEIARAGIEAVKASTNAEIAQQQLSLAMHVVTPSKSAREITSRFVNLDIDSLPMGEIQACGFSIYADNGSWVVDSSSLYSGAIFIRLARRFSPDVPLEVIADDLSKDQSQLSNLLGLRFD